MTRRLLLATCQGEQLAVQHGSDLVLVVLCLAEAAAATAQPCSCSVGGTGSLVGMRRCRRSSDRWLTPGCIARFVGI